jgi:4-aminobutyrate aminotransferase-like enzyme
VEYVKDTDSKEPDVDLAVNIRKEGLKNGAIFGLGGANRNVLKVKLPLIINRDEADQVLTILEKTMGAVIKQ